MSIATKVLRKGVHEKVDRFFDFNKREEILEEGLKIVSATVTEVFIGSGLTLTSVSVNTAGTIVSVTVEGGTIGELYGLECKATLDDGNEISGLGRLIITEG